MFFPILHSFTFNLTLEVYHRIAHCMKRSAKHFKICLIPLSPAVHGAPSRVTDTHRALQWGTGHFFSGHGAPGTICPCSGLWPYVKAGGHELRPESQLFRMCTSEESACPQRPAAVLPVGLQRAWLCPDWSQSGSHAWLKDSI